MRRFLSLLAILLLACGIAGSTANVEPLGGLYDLQPATDLSAIEFPTENDYQTTFFAQKVPTVDRAGLDLREAYAFNFHAGTSGLTRQMVIACATDHSFSVFYLDRDGDQKVTEKEKIQVSLEPISVSDGRVADFTFWNVKPAKPLTLEAAYSAADGSIQARTLTYQFEVLSCYNTFMSKGFCFVTAYPRTYFVGEIATAGARKMKVAIVDGNANGIFNEPGKDFILLDSNLDNIFNWSQERRLLGKGVSGLTAAGKPSALIPQLMAWPQRIFLGPAGAVVSPTDL